MPQDKLVLAYSGGLDTSVAIPWIAETYGYEIIALTIDVGNERDFTTIRDRALQIGASKCIVSDAKDLFIRYFAFPALQAGAIYEGEYPLATALSRPLIAKLLVDVAREEGATAVAHGCTGKGNDQVRFDVSVAALAPDIKVVAPVREHRMTREEEIAFAALGGIALPWSKDKIFSIDENLWGRAIEAGLLEDPWTEPPEATYAWTKSVAAAPEQPRYIEIGFQCGVPVSLDSQELGGVQLVTRLNEIAGEHGVGRIDHLENRLIGIKSREIYEAPAAVVLHQAHKALEDMTLSKQQLRFKERIASEYADLIYNGLWFTAHHQDLAAYVQSTQRHVSGTVRVRLHKGSSTVVGRKSPSSLYSYALATYDKADQFDHTAAVGFIQIWGLPVRTQARVQLIAGANGPFGILEEPGK